LLTNWKRKKNTSALKVTQSWTDIFRWGRQIQIFYWNFLTVSNKPQVTKSTVHFTILLKERKVAICLGVADWLPCPQVCMVELCTCWPVDQLEKDRTANLDNSQMAAFSAARKASH